LDGYQPISGDTDGLWFGVYHSNGQEISLTEGLGGRVTSLHIFDGKVMMKSAQIPIFLCEITCSSPFLKKKNLRLRAVQKRGTCSGNSFTVSMEFNKKWRGKLAF